MDEDHELFEDVFGNFALVCKRFHGLTMTPGAIKNIHLSYFRTGEDKFKIEKVSKVLERSHQLKSLAISDCCTSFLNTFAIQTFQSCPRLRSLKITNCQRNISSSYLEIQHDLQEIPYHWLANTEEKDFKLLQVLEKSAIKLENFELTSACSLYDMSNVEIVQIPKMMAQSLKVLKISAQDIIFPAEIDFFVSECNQIEMIHFEFATFVDMDMKLQFRKVLNGLLGKTAKTLKSICFPELDVNNPEYIKQKKNVPLENLKMCKKLNSI